MPTLHALKSTSLKSMSVTTTATALCHHHHNSFIIANTTVIDKTETTTIAQRQAQHEQQKQQHINCSRGTSSKKMPFRGIYTLHFRYTRRHKCLQHTTEPIFLQDKQYKIWKTTKADSHILFLNDSTQKREFGCSQRKNRPKFEAKQLNTQKQN